MRKYFLLIIAAIFLAACGDDGKKIELDEDFNARDYNARVSKVVVDDKEIRVWFGWTNKSEHDPSHFAMHGDLQVMQNGEQLEEANNSDRKNKQIELKDDDYYSIDYELIDDSDVEIRVVPFEGEKNENKIIVELD